MRMIRNMNVYAIFSTDSKDANKSPVISVGGKEIKFNPLPWLLGVILDRQLTFTPHIDAVTDRSGSSFNMMNTVSHSTWGWPIDSLRSIYRAFVSSQLAGASWQPYGN